MVNVFACFLDFNTDSWHLDLLAALSIIQFFCLSDFSSFFVQQLKLVFQGQLLFSQRLHLLGIHSKLSFLLYQDERSLLKIDNHQLLSFILLCFVVPLYGLEEWDLHCNFKTLHYLKLCNNYTRIHQA